MAEGWQQVHLRPGEKPVCDLCETKLDNQLSKCLDCDLYICDKCSLAHKKVPATKNHNIISRVEREPKKISNISRMCLSHPNDEVNFYCSTCENLICSECIIGTHKKHDFTKIKDFAKQKRQDLKTHLIRVDNIEIPNLTTQIANLNKQKGLNDGKCSENLRKLKNRKLELVSELEKINKDIETECHKIHQKNEVKILTSETKITQDLSEMKTMSSDFTKILHTGSDLEVITAEQKISEKLQSVQSAESNTELHLSSFTEGKTDAEILKTMYGSLQPDKDFIPVSTKTDVKVISQFNCKSTSAEAICPLTDNTALIHYYDSHDNDVVTVDGQVQKTLHFDFIVEDFTMTSQDYIMSSASGKDQKITKLTKEGVVFDTINTAPLKPVGLCESRDGNLLVCLVDGKSYTINKSSRRCVSRLTMKGKILKTYEYHRRSRLFTVPLGVSENINRDVCVVNVTSNTTGHLVILDSAGKLKFTYTGQHLKKEFFPIYVKCDKLGHIVVNDLNNQNVHMLNTEGQFIRYIITENNLSNYPYSLAIENTTGVLWVGGNEGHIYTIRYLE